MTASWIASLTLSLALLFWTTSARAQNADNARADALFREGRALMKKGDYTSACAKLEESQRLDPAPGTAANLGACFEKQGKVGSALLAYQAARDLLPAGDSRLGPIAQQIASLEKRAPRLTIKIATEAPKRTTVERDGRVVDAEKLGVAVAVNPGKHVVVASAPDRNDKHYETELAEGEARQIIVEPGERQDNVISDGPASSPRVKPNVPQRENSADGSSQRTIGFVVAGLGGVALVAAAYFQLDGNQKEDDAKQSCSNSDCNKPADKAYNAATALAIIGGVTVGTGLVLVLTVPSTTRSPANKVTITPSVTTYNASLQVSSVW